MRRAVRAWRARGETGAGGEGVADEFLNRLPGAGEIDRRGFCGVLGSLAAFALAGCGREPEAIVPRAWEDDGGRVPGVPRRYATAVLRRGRALGVLAQVRDGRPIKLEGNAEHPATLGALDARGQAELLKFYHPGRAASFRRGGVIRAREEFLSELRGRIGQTVGGDGVGVLLGPMTSPSVRTQVERVRARLPGVRMYGHDPLDDPDERRAVEMATGRRGEVAVDLGRARVIVSFGADPLGDGPGCIAAARGFGAGRVPGAAGEMSRVYVAEAAPTITGAAADHRLAARPVRLARLVAAFAAEIGVLAGGEPGLSDRERAWVRAAAGDARAAGDGAVVLGGAVLPVELRALLLAVNARLGGAVRVHDSVDGFADGPGVGELAEDLRSGAVSTLLIVDANPVHTAPSDVGFREAMGRAGLVAHAGVTPAETAALADWSVPLAHALESWGDALAPDGTLTLLQPTIAPLYDGWTAGQVLAAMVDPLVPEAMEVVRATHRRRVRGDFEAWWRRTLHDGVAEGTAFDRRPIGDAFDGGDLERWAERGLAAAGAGMELVLRADPRIGGGEDARNEWLQELPTPVTKLVWSNALLVSPGDAGRLGLDDGDVARVRSGERFVDVPVWVTPGHADGCVSLTLGYGRDGAVVPQGVRGGDGYRVRLSGERWVRGGVEVSATGGHIELVTTQHHGRMEGVEAVRVVPLDELGGHEENGERRVPLTMYPEHPTPGRQWGMSIDLSACIGCGACTVACQAENNIPWVGPEQVAMGREMHWIRVDRYYAGPKAAPRILHQPVPCMHCEKAPCEVVCPVGATQHSTDGLNEMIYNRCIGTRYCSNNCPYKVRRFNFHRYSEASAPVRLAHNPEVTVRSRGVMEKCTYCVQRIRNGEIRARIEGRALADGDIVTACQQACPTRAIVFGDISDSESEVSVARADGRRYDLLGELGTRPRTTYLEAVRNAHPGLDAEGLDGEGGA